MIKLKEYQEAITIIESSKARAIGDIISNDTFSTKIPKELKDDFKRLQNENYYLIEALNKKELEDKKELEREYNQKREELYRLEEKILEIDPDFLPNIKPLDFDKIVEVAKESKNCFVYFYVTKDGAFISLFYPNGELEYINIFDFNEDYLYEEIILKWLRSYYKIEGDFMEVSSKILNTLYQKLLKEIIERLRDKNIKEFTIIPNKSLSLLPLHSCWYEKEGKKCYLIDEFAINYIPSITIYSALKTKNLKNNFSSFNIINPMGDLAFSGLEGLKIQNFTNNSNNFWHNRAKTSELKKVTADIIHLSCHGEYNFKNPLNSAFAFSDKHLTLKEIINSLNLEDNYLTILSACETGMINFKEESDEYLGLSIGFLMAKSPTVWGTLWSVSDFSTSLILIKAYEELIKKQKSKIQALRVAQIWVRELKAKEIIEILERYIDEISTQNYSKENNLGLRGVEDYIYIWEKHIKILKKLNKDEKPFNHPYYWAGFSCVGI